MNGINQARNRRKILKNSIKQPNGCWIWQAGVKKGYGQSGYTLDRKQIRIAAHRLSFIVFNSRFELLNNREIFVCHKCDNKLCVNPQHLFAGDWLENAMDDVLRNPNTPGKEWEEAIIKRYGKRHGIRYYRKVKKLLTPPTGVSKLQK